MMEGCGICYEMECVCEEGTQRHLPYHSPTVNYTYYPKKPYDDIERLRWPKTWMYLVRLYHGPTWFQDTRYIRDKEG